MKKILITGNSGYIGSHLSKILSTDYKLFGIDIVKPQAVIVDHILSDIRLPINIDIEFDAVVHLAALINVSESESNPINYYSTNINGTTNILSDIKFKNFIFASTGAAEFCYSAYAISKRAAEDCVREYCTKHNINYTTFRFYNVIGSDGFQNNAPDSLMFNLLKAKHSGEFTIFGNNYDTPDGTCVRDYVHVLEICDAIKTAIEMPSNKVECLGHGVGHSVREIVNLFEKVNDVTLNVKFKDRRPGDIPYSVLTDVSPYMKNLYPIDQLLKV
jgi:UDP-glucose 4-epimerase